MPWRATKFPGIQIKVLYSTTADHHAAVQARARPLSCRCMSTPAGTDLVLEGTLEDHERLRTGPVLLGPGVNQHEAVSRTAPVILAVPEAQPLAYGENSSPRRKPLAWRATGLFKTRRPDGIGGARRQRRIRNPRHRRRASRPAVTPALSRRRAARAVALYSALDLPISEKLGRRSKPRIRHRVRSSVRRGAHLSNASARSYRAASMRRSHAERRFVWKAQRLDRALRAGGCAQHYRGRDRPGRLYVNCALVSVIGYNTNLIKAEDAPKSRRAADPNGAAGWSRAHPGYSGDHSHATFAMVQALGWGFFRKSSRSRR